MADNNFDRLEDVSREVIKLREKSHVLSNMLTDHEGRLFALEKDLDHAEDSIEEVSSTLHVLEKNLVELTTQNKIFKWLAGGCFTVAATIFVEYLQFVR